VQGYTEGWSNEVNCHTVQLGGWDNGWEGKLREGNEGWLAFRFTQKINLVHQAGDRNRAQFMMKEGGQNWVVKLGDKDPYFLLESVKLHGSSLDWDAPV